MRVLLQETRPPEGMADRIMMATRLDREQSSRRRWWYGIAAAVLVSVGASMATLFTTSAERRGVVLAASVIDHILAEEHHLHEDTRVPASSLRYVFSRFGASLTEDIGPVFFAAECPMREKTGVHLVLRGESGPVTVFFMPGEMT